MADDASSGSSRTGTRFEAQILGFFKSEIDAGRFWAKKACCRIFHRKGYHSRDREGLIVFDVSIEVWLPDATDFTLVVLIECKDYSHAVPVDDVEEFFAKVQQVAAARAKAVLASTASFQSGARKFAQAKGIGLLRYFDASTFKWELTRSASASAFASTSDANQLVWRGLDELAHQSTSFDLYIQSPTRTTHSLWDSMDDLIAPSLSSSQLSAVRDARPSNYVPFIALAAIEAQSDEILSSLNYTGGPLPLEALCARESCDAGLTLKTDVEYPIGVSRATLARIQFEPLLVELFRQPLRHAERERFTLVHELSHHLLGHGRYLIREHCDEADFSFERPILHRDDIARMEYQANALASCLLMPRIWFLEAFGKQAARLGLTDRGHGVLYVDSQECNLSAYHVISQALAYEFAVSKEAVRLRLQTMKLINDQRERAGPALVGALLGPPRRRR